MSHLDLVNNNLHRRDMPHENHQLDDAHELAEVKVAKHEQAGMSSIVTEEEEEEDCITSRSKLLNNEHVEKQSKLKKSKDKMSDASLGSNFSFHSSSSESASTFTPNEGMHNERQRHSDGNHGHPHTTGSWLLCWWHRSADLFDRCLARGAFLKLFSAFFYAIASFLIVVINKIILTNYR